MRTLLALALVVSLAGCAGRQKSVEGIPDTPEAEAILAVFGQYEVALEDRDTETIVGLASRDYYEDMGTPDTADDVGYDGLEAKLREDFQQVRTLKVDMSPLRLDVDEDAGEARLDYNYDVRYQLILPSGDQWNNAMDVNQMDFKLEDGAWRIVSGL